MPQSEIETFVKCFLMARRARRQPVNDNCFRLIMKLDEIN